MAPTRIPLIFPAATPAIVGGVVGDLCALDDVRLELGLSDTTQDLYLSATIARQSAAALNFCNRWLGPQWAVESFWPQRDAYPYQLPEGEFPLQLTQWPVAAAAPNIAGIAPPDAPTLSSTAGGSLPAATYWVRTAYITPNGETAASVESTLGISASRLLTVASPPADPARIATGWNVYVGSSQMGETRQNVSPLSIGAAWTEPTGGLVAGVAPPLALTAVENSAVDPRPLAEGVDFRVAADVGQLTRISAGDGYATRWPTLQHTFIYPCGYWTIPADLQDAMIRAVCAKYFSRGRDPTLKSETIPGVYSASYAQPGALKGSPSQFAPDVEAILQNYRVPVVA